MFIISLSLVSDNNYKQRWICTKIIHSCTVQRKKNLLQFKEVLLFNFSAYITQTVFFLNVVRVFFLFCLFFSLLFFLLKKHKRRLLDTSKQNKMLVFLVFGKQWNTYPTTQTKKKQTRYELAAYRIYFSIRADDPLTSLQLQLNKTVCVKVNVYIIMYIIFVYFDQFYTLILIVGLFVS